MIPVACPELLGSESRYVADAMARGQLSMGGYVRRFEEAIANACGALNALTCCNGTSALHLALLALDLSPGDEVIVPALTYVATANAVRYCGGVPVFVDVDQLTWNIDPYEVERRISHRTAGVIAVHLYGLPADMASLSAVCRANGIWLVEDAAEAIGARVLGAPVGALGDVGTLSFFGNKVITTGEGGAVLTQNAATAERMRLLRGQGVKTTGRYDHEIVGYNYRMGELQAAVGLGQIECLAQHLSRRSAVCDRYRAWALDHGITYQLAPDHAIGSDWMFTCLLPRGVDRDGAAASMYAAGIQTRPAFPLVSRMPMYLTDEEFPIAHDVSTRGITLPTHGGLTEQQQEKVCHQLQEALACATHR